MIAVISQPAIRKAESEDYTNGRQAGREKTKMIDNKSRPHQRRLFYTNGKKEERK
jgi:hypothetical protein